MANQPNAIVPLSQETFQQGQREAISPPYKNKYGNAKKAYTYRNRDNEILFFVVKYENDNIFLPFYFCRDGWINKIPKNISKIELYNILNTKNETKNIIIVNNEEQTKIKIKGWELTTWAGGDSKTVEYSNWKSLINIENVIIWTDEKSAKKIKKRIAHSIPITEISFDNCKDHLSIIERFTKNKDTYSSLNDPYELYIMFLHEFYGHECLDHIDDVFWRYQEDEHYWVQENKSNIQSNFQTWMLTPRGKDKISIVDYLRADGENPNLIINKSLEYISRHSAGEIYGNPFKKSALSPYIHLKNGALFLERKNKYHEWFSRQENNEHFFRKKYPVHCCEFEFNEKHLENIDINETPVFKYIIDSFIPNDLKLSKDETQKTYEFFCQIIAYALSPIKPTEYFFGLYGGEGTGKSFFIEILKDIIGREFFVERPIDEMTGNNRFASSSFWGSKVYVEPDMKTDAILPESFIKAFAGEKNITVEQKNKQEIKDVGISIAMFFVSNFDFITKGMIGIARRIIYIPFKNKIEKPDRLLRYKIRGKEKKGAESGKEKGKQYDERPAILALAVKSWKTFIKNNSNFTIPEWINESKDEWKNKSNTVMGFLNDNYFTHKKYADISRKDLYDEYVEWCKNEAGHRELGKRRFNEEIDRTKDIKVIRRSNGMRVIFFENKKWDASESDPF